MKTSILKTTRLIRTIQIIFIVFFTLIIFIIYDTMKETKQSIFLPILLAALIVTVVGFLAVSNFKISQKRAKLNSQIELLQKEFQVLQTQQGLLQTQVSQSLEESYLEKEARESFNMKKPGEEVVTILPAEEKARVEEEKTFWQKIWEKIRF